MRLTLQSQAIGDVVVIRCHGRIVLGAELDALQTEFEKQTRIPGTTILASNQVVLQLAETEYVDSAGLGAMVRLFGILRAAGGDLKLCQCSPFVLRVLEVTRLLSVFPTYPSEAEAIAAFSESAPPSREELASSKTRIVCIDTSSDLLAGLNALLTRSGYEVFTTRYLGDAVTLVHATRPRLVICGSGTSGALEDEALEKLRSSGSKLQILHLPSDFSTADAGEAGMHLLQQVRSALAT